MGWIGRAFGRALIYNRARETFYASRQATRQAQRKPQRKSTGRRQEAKVAGMDAAVRFTCLRCGHEFHQHFDRQLDTDDAYAPCPKCGKQAIWRCIDIHQENLVVP